MLSRDFLSCGCSSVLPDFIMAIGVEVFRVFVSLSEALFLLLGFNGMSFTWLLECSWIVSRQLIRGSSAFLFRYPSLAGASVLSSRGAGVVSSRGCSVICFAAASVWSLVAMFRCPFLAAAYVWSCVYFRTVSRPGGFTGIGVLVLCCVTMWLVHLALSVSQDFEVCGGFRLNFCCVTMWLVDLALFVSQDFEVHSCFRMKLCCMATWLANLALSVSREDRDILPSEALFPFSGFRTWGCCMTT